MKRHRRGVQPRPLRYRGRLNRRGRKAVRMHWRRYAVVAGAMWDGAFEPLYPGLRQEEFRDYEEKHIRGELVRELLLSGRVTIDPPGGAR